MKIELDKYDFELIYKSICYFDMYEDGNYQYYYVSDFTEGHQIIEGVEVK